MVIVKTFSGCTVITMEKNNYMVDFKVKISETDLAQVFKNLPVHMDRHE